MTGTPEWLSAARCRQLGIPPGEFVPKPGGAPSARAEAACRVCPVGGPDGPCAADRGGDVGLRGDGFVEERARTHLRNCERCGQVFRAAGGAYKWCDWCASVAGTRRGQRKGATA